MLTDGNMSAKSAAFARVLPHIQRTAEGKPTKDVQRDATQWGELYAWPYQKPGSTSIAPRDVESAEKATAHELSIKTFHKTLCVCDHVRLGLNHVTLTRSNNI
jgi:hypothetical protein